MRQERMEEGQSARNEEEKGKGWKKMSLFKRGDRLLTCPDRCGWMFTVNYFSLGAAFTAIHVVLLHCGPHDRDGESEPLEAVPSSLTDVFLSLG